MSIAEIYAWLATNGPALMALVGAIVMGARVIVKLTPTPKDDNVLAGVVKLLKHLGLYIE